MCISQERKIKEQSASTQAAPSFRIFSTAPRAPIAPEAASSSVAPISAKNKSSVDTDVNPAPTIAQTPDKKKSHKRTSSATASTADTDPAPEQSSAPTNSHHDEQSLKAIGSKLQACCSDLERKLADTETTVQHLINEHQQLEASEREHGVSLLEVSHCPTYRLPLLCMYCPFCCAVLFVRTHDCELHESTASVLVCVIRASAISLPRI
jgi:hypothetical protein